MTKVLIVEDNEINRDVLSRLLVRRGYEVDLAGDAFQATSAVEASVPDIILMDMGLPEIDGWELTRRFKASSKTRSIPIIALTAHAVSSDRKRALDAGCDEYESKPVEMDRLVEKMELFTAGARQ